VGPLTAVAEDVSARFDRVALGLLRDDLTRITAPADARRPAGSPAT
jgi:hypothetical protein